MDVHAESLALVEEWLVELTFKSPLSDGPVAPKTIKRYRDVVVGRALRKPGYQVQPLLEWWAVVAPGVPIWLVSREQLIEFYSLPVRAAGGTTKPPSDSDRNSKRSAVKNLLSYMQDEGRPVNNKAKNYMPPYEQKLADKRKAVKLDPIGDGVFKAMWSWNGMPFNVRLWMGQCALLGQRIDEAANLRPEGIDLEARTATFVGKGYKERTVHYGDLASDYWPLLPHLDELYEGWIKMFEETAFEAQEEQARDGADSIEHGRVFFHPDTAGMVSYHRETKAQVFLPTDRDRNRFDKSFQVVHFRSGFERRTYHPHQLRHFFAMNLWRAGAEFRFIKAQMGHDQDVTTGAYVDYNHNAHGRERARNQRLRGVNLDE